MADLTTQLEQLLGGHADRIGARIGADPAQTQTAISAAIPTLLAALSRESQDPGLRQAIERDHDGSVLDDLDGYVDGTANLSPRATDGAGILEHTLGDRQDTVARALSQKSGLDLGSIMQLLPLLAPVVMGMLGKKTRSGEGGFGLDDLGGILGGEAQTAQSRFPDIGDLLGGLGAGSGQAGQSGGLGDLIGSVLGNRSDSSSR